MLCYVMLWYSILLFNCFKRVMARLHAQKALIARHARGIFDMYCITIRVVANEVKLLV